MGFTYALFVTNQAVVSYTAIPPLPMSEFAEQILDWAVYFCCTFLRVASTRRYLASCPMKPGLSSPAAFRFCSRDHPSYSLTFYITLDIFCQSNYRCYTTTSNYTLKQLPPANSLTKELLGIFSLLIPKK